MGRRSLQLRSHFGRSRRNSFRAPHLHTSQSNNCSVRCKEGRSTTSRLLSGALTLSCREMQSVRESGICSYLVGITYC